MHMRIFIMSPASFRIKELFLFLFILYLPAAVLDLLVAGCSTCMGSFLH